MGRKKKKKPITIKSEETTTIFGVLSLAISAFLIASAFLTNGYFVRVHLIFGLGLYFAALLFLIFALRMFGNKFRFNKGLSIISFAIFLLSFLGFFQAVFGQYRTDMTSLLSGGGELGEGVASAMRSAVGNELGVTILFLVALVSLLVGLSVPMSTIFKAIKAITNGITTLIAEKLYPISKDGISHLHTKYKDKKASPVAKDNLLPQAKPQEVKTDGSMMMVGDLSGRNSIPVNERPQAPQDGTAPHKPVEASEEFSDWHYPPIDLFNKPKPFVVQNENVKKNSDIIEKTLESFGILAKVADVKTGPAVTQYALQITMGTKVAKINNLSKDIALALAAPSGMIRVEAPIPGTSLVGIEMPNMHPNLVTIREILDSAEMQQPHMKLPITMGRDVAGNIVVRDLQKMPHLLIAGSTGSGKSVTVNSFIISLLCKHSPSELRFIMVDPKQVELSQYNGIPHLLVPVITDMEKVVSALKWAVVEMENRYKMFKQVQSRNIEQYNQRKDVVPIPYIVIIIDEMADLMMLQGVEAETSIVRLAQMARAVGIHLLLATQRPSVNVITGLIKANVPARIGMSVTSIIDSRVILDTGGAETLLGKGDMLFKQPDSIRPLRVQGVMVSDDEIEKVLMFIREQSPTIEYTEEITSFAADGEGKAMGNSGSDDTMFPDAVRVVVHAGRGSASILQSKLRIGYARAARLIEELEACGVVGKQDGSKPREVLVTDAEIFLGQQKNTNENSR